MFGLLFVPESPRFLARRGRADAARAVLTRIRGSAAAAEAEMAEIEAVREEEGRVTWREVFGPRYRGPMAAGIGLAVISAWWCVPPMSLRLRVLRPRMLTLCMRPAFAAASTP